MVEVSKVRATKVEASRAIWQVMPHGTATRWLSAMSDVLVNVKKYVYKKQGGVVFGRHIRNKNTKISSEGFVAI